MLSNSKTSKQNFKTISKFSSSLVYLCPKMEIDILTRKGKTVKLMMHNMPNKPNITGTTFLAISTSSNCKYYW